MLTTSNHEGGHSIKTHRANLCCLGCVSVSQNSQPKYGFCVPRSDATERGFTLIELVVAIAISAVVATLMYSFMDSVLKTNGGHRRAGDELARLQKALIVMQRDVEQTVDRPVRDSFGDSQGPVIVNDGLGFEVSRVGWSVPPFTRSQRSEVQRVRYEFTDDEIVRTHWVTPDITADTSDRNPAVTTLLKDIEAFEVRVAQVNGASDDVNWLRAWPPQSGQGFDPDGNPLTAPTLPDLMEVSIEHTRFGKLRRVFRIVGVGAGPTELPLRPENQGGDNAPNADSPVENPDENVPDDPENASDEPGDVVEGDQ